MCQKGVGRNSVYCGSCKHWVHKRCSGFKGRLIDTPYFKCHRGLHLPGSEKEAHKFKLGNFDYKRMDKFCNLGDMLSASAGADASSVTQIRTSWKKFRELLPLLTSRVFSHKMKGNIQACVTSAMLYGSETGRLRSCSLQWTEMQMARWMHSSSLSEQRPSEEIQNIG